MKEPVRFILVYYAAARLSLRIKQVRLASVYTLINVYMRIKA